MKAYLEVILGNLQLSITSVHVRFEGDLPGAAGAGRTAERFAAGLTLQELSATTVDAGGNEAFETKGLAARLHKRAVLKRLAVYYDPGAAPLLPDPAMYRSLTAAQWTALFMPGVDNVSSQAITQAQLGALAPHAQAAAAAVPARQYLLAPVGGSARYERRGRTEAPPGQGDAVQTVSLRLDAVDLRLCKHQLTHFQCVGDALSAALRRAPHAHLRPRCRPGAPGCVPGEWWRYAVAAGHTMRGKRARLTWARLREVALARRAYVAVYAAHLRATGSGIKSSGSKGAKGGVAVPPPCMDAQLRLLEDSLEAETCLLFRVLAHRQVVLDSAAAISRQSSSGQPKSPIVAAPAAAAVPVTPPGKASRAMGWLLGRTAADPAANAAAVVAASPAEADGAESKSVPGGLTPEEWAALTEAFELSDAHLDAAAAAAKAAPPHPESLTLKASVSVDTGSVQLLPGAGAAGVPPLLRTALTSSTASMDAYPTPRRAMSVTVSSMTADASGVTLLRTVATSASPAQAPGRQALVVRFEAHPPGLRAAKALWVTTAPCYVVADVDAVRGLTTFFQPPSHLNTQDLARTVVDTATDTAAAAAAQAARAMEGQALQLALDLQLAGPKVLLPSSRGGSGAADGASLLLDLGHFSFASSPAPAGVTDAFALALRDVSAVFVPHSWSWDSSGQAPTGNVSPLLSPTGATATLLRCAYPTASKPRVAISVEVPRLCGEVSPLGVHRLMAVIGALSPVWTRSTGPPWASAVYAAPVWVLTRNGSAPGRLVWMRRWGAIAGEYLYLLDSPEAGATTKPAVISLRHGVYAAPVPAKKADGTHNVVALAPLGVHVSACTSDSRTTLLRCDDGDAAAAWLGALQSVRERRHAQHARRALATATRGQHRDSMAAQLAALSLEESFHGASVMAGSGEPSTPPDERAAFADAQGTPDSDDGGAGDEFADAESDVDEEEDGAGSDSHDSEAQRDEPSSAHVASFVLDARLGSLDVSLAGLVPGGKGSERVIVALRADGAGVQYTQRPHDMALSVRLQSLVVTDRLAPPSRGSLDGAGDVYVLTSQATPVARTFPHLVHRSPSGLVAPPAATASAPDDALVRFSYKTWTDGSPDYAGVACDISARLAAVAAAVRRPTIAALYRLMYDYAPQRHATPPAPSAQSHATAVAAGVAAGKAAAEALVAWHALSTESEHPAAAALGGVPRVVMRIDVAMESLLAQLLLEDGSELAGASVEHVGAVVTLRQATLEVTTTLGNVRLRDGRAAPDAPYRWILDLRDRHVDAHAQPVAAAQQPGAASSLIALQFATHVKGEEADGADMSLTATVSAVRVVYLNRVIMELLSYIYGLTAALARPAASVANAAAAATAAVVTAAPAAVSAPARESKALRLSVDVASPLVVLPRHSSSGERADVDLGSLTYRAGPVRRGPGNSHWFEVSSLELRGVSVLARSGATPGGTSLVHRLEGVHMSMRRPLRGGCVATAPAVDMHIDVPPIAASLSTAEYNFVCVVLGDNFRETCALPPPVPTEGEVEAQPAGGQVVAAAAAGAATAAAVAPPPVGGAAHQLRFRLTTCLREVRLTLYDGAGRTRPLAEARLVQGWACVTTDAARGVRVSAAVHDLSVHDARVTTAESRRLVLGVEVQHPGAATSLAALISASGAPTLLHRSNSTGGALSRRATASLNAPNTAPALMVLDYSTSIAEGMRIRLRLQRPSLAVEMSFLLAVGRFFAPWLAGGTADAVDAVLPRDLSLRPGGPGTATTLSSDLALGPRRRLLADAPLDKGVEDAAIAGEFVLDGSGCALVLPPGPVSRHTPTVPCILVGPRRTLTLRNVRIVRAERLEECTKLAPGARLNLDPTAQLVYGADDGGADAGGAASTSPPATQRARALSPSRARALSPTRSGSQPLQPQPARQPYAFLLDIDIIGAQLRFVEPQPASGMGGRGGEATHSPAGGHSDAATAPGWVRARAGAALQMSSDGLGAMTLGTQVRGLTLEARLPHAEGAPLPMLSPADASLTYVKAVDTVSRVGVTTSAIDLRLSPRLLSLASGLVATASSVFTSLPVRQSAGFKRMWTAPLVASVRGDIAQGFIPDDGAAASGRLCFWRPVAPPGYATLGDAATAGEAPPAASARVLRDTGALCMAPTGYVQRLALPGGLTLWEPVPPAGCVAVGCVASLGPDPPALSAVRCPRAALVVEAEPVECVHSDDAGAVWRIGNSSGTAVCAPGSGAPKPEASMLWDLRDPLGVEAQEAAPPPPPPQQQPQQSSAPQLADSSASSLVRRLSSRTAKPPCCAVTVVDFARLWWSVNTHQKQDVSFWRPVCPPGYYPVGDTVSTSLRPPQRALIVRDDGDGAVAPPQSFVQVFRDTGSRAKKAERDGTLAFWRPVPAPGYVAMGCVVTPNHRTPSPEVVRCLRKDLVAERQAPKSCLWTTAGAERKLGTQRISIWPVDKRTSTFWAAEPPPGAAPNVPAGTKADLVDTSFYELTPPDESSSSHGGSVHAGTAAGSLNVSITLGDVGALFFYVASSTGRPLPLLDFTLRKCRAQMNSRSVGHAGRSSGMPTSVMDLEVTAELTAEVYNTRADAWEPVIEPWALALRVESRSAQSGWRPRGTVVSLDSRGELRLVVSHALADTLLHYRADAAASGAEDAAGGSAAHGHHAASRTAPLLNCLGVTAYVRSGPGRRVHALLPGDALDVPLPSPAALSRHALAQAEARRTVVMDVLAVRCDSLPHDDAAALSELPLAACMRATARCRSVRAVTCARTAPVHMPLPGAPPAAWTEQLLLELPAVVAPMSRADEAAGGGVDHTEIVISLALCDASSAEAAKDTAAAPPVSKSASGAGADDARDGDAAMHITLRGAGASLPASWLDLGGGAFVRASFRVLEAATVASDPFTADNGAVDMDAADDDEVSVLDGEDGDGDPSATGLRRSASSAAAAAAAQSLDFITVMQFEQVWNTENSGAARVASVWRPLLPPGCHSLGDCMVQGTNPPRSVLTLFHPAAEEETTPVSVPPARYDSVYHDAPPGQRQTKGGENPIVVWRPVPPPGYVALGCVVTRTTAPPPPNAVVCLRADLTARADAPPLPIWESTGAEAKLGPGQCSCWRLDDRTGAFWAEPDVRRATLLASPLWRLPDGAAHTSDEVGGTGSGSPQSHGRAPKVEIALRPEGPWSRLWRRRGTDAEGVTPVPVGDGAFVLADRSNRAVAQEGTARLRSPLQVLNSTSLPLQLRLVPLPPDSGDTPAVWIEEVFENERLIPLRGWGDPPLRAVGKFHARFSARGGSHNSDEFPQLEAPHGWQWTGPWQVDLSWLSADKQKALEASSPGTGTKGWFYATTFSGHTFPPPQGAEWPGVCTTRRRRWVRTRVRREVLPLLASKSNDAALATDALAAAAAYSAAAAASIDGLPIVDLGCVDPEQRVAIPWGCTRGYPPYELQLRPMYIPGPRAEDGSLLPATTAAAAWSSALPASGPRARVAQVSGLAGAVADGATQVVGCADDGATTGDTPRKSRTGPPASSPGHHALWFALTASAGAVTVGGGLEAPDVSVVVTPPLQVENLTSAAARYCVWEGDLGAPPDTYRAVQAGTLPSGGCVSVYGVDPRSSSFLSWAAPAEGFEPAPGAAPALLFPPFWQDAQPAGGGQTEEEGGGGDGNVGQTSEALPTVALHVARPSDGAILELRLEREQVGRGAVRMVRLSAPFLMVNRTRLPLGFWLHGLSAEDKEASDKAMAQSAGLGGDDDDARAPGAGSNTSYLVVSTEQPPPTDGSGTRYQGESRLSAGTMGMLAPPGLASSDVAMRLRVGGSGPSTPIRLGATMPTLVNAVLPDKRLAQVVVSAEPGAGRFARTTVITVDPRVTLSNRTGEMLQVKQTGIPDKPVPGRSQWAAPLVLHPGDAAVPLVWDDYLKTPAMELGIDTGKWSRPISVSQGEAHVVLAAPRDDFTPGAGAQPRVVHLSAEQAATGRVHIALRNANAPAPVRIENTTGVALAARQAATLQGGTPWVGIQPHANVPQAWETSWGAGIAAAVEIRCPKRSGESVVVTSSANDALRVSLTPSDDVMAVAATIEGTDRQALVLVLPDGRRANVRVRAEGAVRVVTIAVDAALHRTASSTAVVGGASEFDLSVRVLEIKLSLIDHTPRELLLLSLDRLSYTHATGLANGSASVTDFKVVALQLDDQSAGTSFPVVLWHSTENQQEALLHLAMTETGVASERGGGAASGERSHPYVCVDVTPAPLHLRLHEPLIWHLLTFAEKLKLAKSSSAGPATAAAATQQAPQVSTAVVRADPLVTIGSLALSAAALRITFKGEPNSRPVGGLGGGLLAFANLDSAPVSLSPIVHESLRMRQSGITPMLVRAVTRQLTLQSVRLLTGVDILADASDTLSQISGSLASITGDTHWQERSSSRRMVEETSMAGALVHGGEAMAAGLFRGITGVVTKPVEGARDKGLSGFFTGIGRGMAGLVLQPVSGAVDLASKAVEGVNASKANVVDLVRVGAGNTRRRPPLAIGASGVVRRYDRKAAEGQAMLRLAEWRAVGSAGGVVDRLDLFKTKSKFGKDTYEWHDDLPDGRVALVTNQRAMLLERPGQGDVLVERCSIAWVVDFTDILSVAQEQGSNAVVLQLRNKAKERLLSGTVAARTFSCTPGTDQAARLLAAIQEGLRELALQQVIVRASA